MMPSGPNANGSCEAHAEYSATFGLGLITSWPLLRDIRLSLSLSVPQLPQIGVDVSKSSTIGDGVQGPGASTPLTGSKLSTRSHPAVAISTARSARIVTSSCRESG